MKKIETKICPKCKLKYKRPSAISKVDNKTEICELCGTAESIAIFRLAVDRREIEISTNKETELEIQIKKEIKRSIDKDGLPYYVTKGGTKISVAPIENLEHY